MWDDDRSSSGDLDWEFDLHLFAGNSTGMEVGRINQNHGRCARRFAQSKGSDHCCTKAGWPDPPSETRGTLPKSDAFHNADIAVDGQIAKRFRTSTGLRPPNLKKVDLRSVPNPQHFPWIVRGEIAAAADL
jgi:hypothetical protein